jgi:hypothetical protein
MRENGQCVRRVEIQFLMERVPLVRRTSVRGKGVFGPDKLKFARAKLINSPSLNRAFEHLKRWSRWGDPPQLDEW